MKGRIMIRQDFSFFDIAIRFNNNSATISRKFGDTFENP